MKTVKQEHALQRHKEREKKDKERKQKLKEREARKEEQRRARIPKGSKKVFRETEKEESRCGEKEEGAEGREQLESARQKDSNPPAEVANANVKDSSLKSETQKSKKKPIDDVIIQQARSR